MYDFYTYDTVANVPDTKVSLKYGDIEGLWTFLYFSYGKGSATAFYSEPDTLLTKTMKATHEAPKYLRFIVGGKDSKFNGFNG